MEETLDILILGCGYTGQRVAKRFLSKGARVTVTTRTPEKLASLGAEAITVNQLSKHVCPGMLVLHSIPPEGSGNVLEALSGNAARVVYLSSTAVYGNETAVDENTPVDPSTESARARIDAEQEIAQGPWSTLVLRPAAIYGPGRGVQESIQRGEHSLSDRYVSRIHVDDLAAHAEAALLSSLTGAYPVADEEPCTSREIAEFCAELLNIPVTGPPHAPERGAGPGYAGRSPRFANNRRVDGSAVRRALGITLQYPSYRFGVPASLSSI
ncbi:MAG: NAD-dependent epimerase/dehydratase family protein [Bryobacteraceae bacterium]